jgi:4-carboxymuconolactone decarboxylase
MDRDAWRLISQGPDQRGKDAVERCANRPDAQVAGTGTRRIPALLLCTLDFRNDAPRAADERLASRGQANVTARPFEQHDPEFLLKPTDPVAERWLGQIQRRRRPPKVKRLGEDEEGTKLLKIHQGVLSYGIPDRLDFFPWCLYVPLDIHPPDAAASQCRPPSPSGAFMSESAAGSPAQQIIGDFAPKLVSLTDDVLFADVWERPELSRRDRSLITVAALIASGDHERLHSPLNQHLDLARKNGVTEDELKEVIIHLAFYAGWPKAVSAMQAAKRAFEH